MERYTNEDFEHMTTNAKKAFKELLKLGAPVKIWHQTNPNYQDYRGYFWISAEEGCSWEWLDFYSPNLSMGSEVLNKVLDKYDLYFEWENAAVAGVYDQG